MSGKLRVSKPFQMSLSTAEDEVNYFTGQPVSLHVPEPSTAFLPGTYRVVDGQLCLILPGVPPG